MREERRGHGLLIRTAKKRSISACILGMRVGLGGRKGGWVAGWGGPVVAVVVVIVVVVAVRVAVVVEVEVSSSSNSTFLHPVQCLNREFLQSS